MTPLAVAITDMLYIPCLLISGSSTLSTETPYYLFQNNTVAQ